MAHTRRGFKGGVRATTIVGAINDSATTVPGADLSTWAGINSHGVGTATINQDEPDEETITFTAVSGGNLTGVVRGAGGTTPQAHANGATLTHTSSVTDFDEANEVVAQANTWADWTPSYAGLGSMTLTEGSHPSNHRRFLTIGKLCVVSFSQLVTFGGTRQNLFTVSLPAASANNRVVLSCDVENAVGRAISGDTTTTVSIQRYDGATFAATTTHLTFAGVYEVA